MKAAKSHANATAVDLRQRRALTRFTTTAQFRLAGLKPNFDIMQELYHDFGRAEEFSRASFCLRSAPSAGKRMGIQS